MPLLIMKEKVIHMLDKLIFGRYIPGDSFIHRLDPRAKLLASFALSLIHI